MKRGADGGDAVAKEGEARSEKSRPEHWRCPRCGEDRTGSGFVWRDGWVCNGCAANIRMAATGCQLQGSCDEKAKAANQMCVIVL